MIKFWDSLYLTFFIVGINLVTDLLMPYGLLGFIVLTVVWFIFWSWLNATFVSITYIKEQLEKAGNNDNKNSGGSNT